MNNFFEKLAQTFSPYILLITRVLVGYMFLLHGTAKFFELPISMTGGNGAVPLFSLFGVAGVLEIVGGILLILGLFTRATAFILAGQMAVAYFMFHAASGAIFDPISNKGEAAALFSMVFLLLWHSGAGKLSLDAKLRK
ncbi:DoxX family protein [Glaesserella parasuis]|uniref:DoxX family protein n=1 Tax=Glaesserella parasuis TaxID=738 RepID=UPI0024365C40|nr:DoxX family protein [Glaesserella parasuis]MDG6446578.1 DoxX family protein [Glaesserella parasuis]